MDVLVVLLLASLVAAFTAAAVLLVLALRGEHREEEEAPPLAEEAPPLPALGGGVAPTVPGSEGGWISELFGEPLLGGGAASQPLASDAVASRLLFVLEEARSVPLEELGLRVGASREAIARAVKELERRGIVRVEGGVVVFSERGEKLITKLREKYFEKKRWLESI